MSSYKDAGVDIDAGTRAVELMKDAVIATYTPQVLAGIGSFGGLYDASALKRMDSPILVASTDGVGTKTKVAAKLNKWDTIGRDLVNHCVNDILVQGARPLFFLDYVASSKLDAEHIAAVVTGSAHACREIGCALIGGETAEMPGVYQKGEIDLVGTIIGVIPDRASLIDGKRIEAGDAVLSLPSTGLHTNGFSLARRLLDKLDWNEPNDELGTTVGEALLATHRCYLMEITKLRASGIDIKGLAHITGGGVTDNLPRILPEGTGALIRRSSWTEPSIFGLIEELGNVDADEMFHTFNMGMGMLVVVSPEQTKAALNVLNELRQVGEIEVGGGVTVA
jgi:phosphoribosylformylglycinamidine cyclo-ligase